MDRDPTHAQSGVPTNNCSGPAILNAFLAAVGPVADSLEQAGEMAAEDAVRWKHGIYGPMMLWGLEPDDLEAPVLM